MQSRRPRFSGILGQRETGGFIPENPLEPKHHVGAAPSRDSHACGVSGQCHGLVYGLHENCDRL